MPRVSSQKAAKDYPSHGIMKGDTYYKWSFRYGGSYKSKTYPRSSQLTQSKYSAVYGALEGLMDTCEDKTATIQDIVDNIESAASEIRDVAEEYNEADEAFGGHQGVNYERAESCEQCASELDDVENRFSGLDTFGEGEDYETESEAREALVDELGSIGVEEV